MKHNYNSTTEQGKNHRATQKSNEFKASMENHRAATQNKENEHAPAMDNIRQSLHTQKQLNDHNTMLQTKFVQQEEIILYLAETIASLKTENEYLKRLIKRALTIENPDAEALNRPSKKRKDVHSEEETEEEE